MIAGMPRPKVSSPRPAAKAKNAKAPTAGEIAQAVYSATFKALSKPVKQISEQIPTKDAAAVVGFTEALATLLVAQIARAVEDNVSGRAAQRETTLEMLNAALDAARERLAAKFKFLVPEDTRGIKLVADLRQVGPFVGGVK